MNKILLFVNFFLIVFPLYSEQQVTHSSLLGTWTYFYITKDFFAEDKIIASEQTLTFKDGQNAILIINAQEKEYMQNTNYKLQYGLSLRDNAPYLSLYSTESSQVLGSYVRMPSTDSLEMAADPYFRTKKQLYKRAPSFQVQESTVPDEYDSND